MPSSVASSGGCHDDQRAGRYGRGALLGDEPRGGARAREGVVRGVAAHAQLDLRGVLEADDLETPAGGPQRRRDRRASSGAIANAWALRSPMSAVAPTGTAT